MAAVLRENCEDIDVEILDCPIEEMGWHATEKAMGRRKPDILCIGDETVSSHEALKLARMTKDLFPECIVIAGGLYFAHAIEDSLRDHPIDFIVRGEGEFTLLELVRALKMRRSYRAIAGLAYMHKGQVHVNPLREPVDMDQLPMPAYDLLPMEKYGKGSTNHKDFVALEHSRGCTGNCNFCVLWKQMGKPSGKGVRSCFRTKSVKKSVDEVLELTEKYGRRTFCWVDPSWNLDPKWNDAFSREMINHDLDITHSAWMRSDCIVRDEKCGTFRRQILAGLRQAMIGVERTDDAELSGLSKNLSFQTTKEAFDILSRHPDVLSVATYIYGIPDETPRSMRNFYTRLSEIPFDIGVPIPLTPNPGTQQFEELRNLGLVEVHDYRFYNFVNPIARSKHMSRNQLLVNMIWNELRVRTKKEQLQEKKEGRRSTARRNLAFSKAKMTLRYVRGMLQESITGTPYNYNIKPEWYE